MSTISVSLESITVNDGTEIEVPARGTILIVGPNNSGKSQALRDIASHLGQETVGVVVKGVKVTKVGTDTDFRSYFTELGAISVSSGGEERFAYMGHGPYPVTSGLSWWAARGTIPVISALFLLHADTETRLSVSKPSDAMNLYEATSLTPIQQMYARPEIEKALSKISRSAFGLGILLDRYAGGSQWAIRVGEAPSSNNPHPDAEFLQKIQEMPLLHQQGDGVRSLIGLMLLWLSSNPSIGLVDEPEAFLHPPQAAFIAKELADRAWDGDQQLVLSTHSSDVVRGVLNSKGVHTVLRVTRQEDVNHFAQVIAEDIETLWSDPLLRYSNLLEGLFTDAVVVCEADSDCKYYSAIRDAVAESDTQPSEERRSPDILFTHCNGKHRLHVAVSAMRAASVPVLVIADFDLLRECHVIERLVLACGGRFEGNLKQDWKIVSSAIDNDIKAPSLPFVKEEVAKTLDRFSGSTLTSQQAAEIRDLVKADSGWDKVKRAGLAEVPAGQAYRAAERLLSNLGKLGIHVVPVGQVESFVPQVDGHGPAWVANVLEQSLHKAPTSDTARKFLAKALDGLAAFA